MEKKDERILILIDGSNFYHSTKNIIEQGHEIDFQKIINELVRNRRLVNTFYDTALLDKNYNLEKYNEHKKFIEDLKQIPKV